MPKCCRIVRLRILICLLGWTLLNEGGGQVTMTLEKAQPLNDKNPTSLRLDITSVGSNGWVGVINQGYKGISIASNDPMLLPADDTSSSGDHKWLDWMKQYRRRAKAAGERIEYRAGQNLPPLVFTPESLRISPAPSPLPLRSRMVPSSPRKVSSARARTGESMR